MTRLRQIVPHVAAVAVAMSVASAAIVTLYHFDSERRVGDRVCESAVENREGVRRTWLAAREFLMRTQETERGREGIRMLFQEVLDEIPPLECRGRKPVEVR